MLTNQVIFRESGQYDKEVIERLRLERLGLSRIASLDGCVSLMELVLSGNEITLIAGLEGLVSLRRLDLSYNRIRKIENLAHLSSLQMLDVRGNLIGDIQDLQCMSKLEDFQSLYFRGVDGEDANPVCSIDNYGEQVLRLLPNLQQLDGGHVQVGATFRALESHLLAVTDTSGTVSPPSEPWFTAADTAVNSDVDLIVKQSKPLQGPLDIHAKISDTLREECTHLLRKAQSSLSKMAK